jgi:hypothetical protein
VRIDDGATDESLADLYVTPTLPASKVEGAKGYIDHTSWDYKRSFAVEVECYPKRHWDRLKDNYQRNKKMGFPTVFIVPNQTDEEALKEKLLEWNATLVASSSRFEPDHPEMATIEVVGLLDNQNKDQSETSQPCETEPAKQQIEQTPQEHFTTTLEQTTPSETEAAPSVDEAFFQKEQLLLGLAGKGWRFRLKEAKGKKYLCTRNDKEEHSIGLFDDKTKTIIDKHKIKVTGYNDL